MQSSWWPCGPLEAQSSLAWLPKLTRGLLATRPVFWVTREVTCRNMVFSRLNSCHVHLRKEIPQKGSGAEGLGDREGLLSYHQSALKSTGTEMLRALEDSLGCCLAVGLEGFTAPAHLSPGGQVGRKQLPGQSATLRPVKWPCCLHGHWLSSGGLSLHTFPQRA